MQGRSMEMQAGSGRDGGYIKAKSSARDGDNIGNEPEDVAVYVCEMTGNLKQLATDADLKFLAYLIDMAHIEACSAMTRRHSDDEQP